MQYENANQFNFDAMGVENNLVWLCSLSQIKIVQIIFLENLPRCSASVGINP